VVEVTSLSASLARCAWISLMDDHCDALTPDEDRIALLKDRMSKLTPDETLDHLAWRKRLFRKLHDALFEECLGKMDPKFLDSECCDPPSKGMPPKPQGPDVRLWKETGPFPEKP